jgi:8-oxo-dGTP diphosphatase
MSLRAAVYVILRQSCLRRIARADLSRSSDGRSGRQPESGDHSVLMMRRQGGWGAGQWSLPAGHVEVANRETPAAAASREVMEEIGVDVAEEDLRIVHVTYRPSGPDITYVDFFLEATQWTGTPVNLEPSKCDGLEFVEAGKLRTNTLPHVKDAIDRWRNPTASPFSVVPYTDLDQ